MVQLTLCNGECNSELLAVCLCTYFAIVHLKEMFSDDDCNGEVIKRYWESERKWMYQYNRYVLLVLQCKSYC